MIATLHHCTARLYWIRSFWKLRTRANIKKKSALNFDDERGNCVHDDYRKCPYRMVLELTFILSPGNSAGTPNKKQYYYGDNDENGFKRFLVVGRRRHIGDQSGRRKHCLISLWNRNEIRRETGRILVGRYRHPVRDGTVRHEQQ